jgi:hypothetical protein
MIALAIISGANPIPERDQQKWKPVLRPIALLNIKSA